MLPQSQEKRYHYITKVTGLEKTLIYHSHRTGGNATLPRSQDNWYHFITRVTGMEDTLRINHFFVFSTVKLDRN